MRTPQEDSTGDSCLTSRASSLFPLIDSSRDMLQRKALPDSQSFGLTEVSENAAAMRNRCRVTTWPAVHSLSTPRFSRLNLRDYHRQQSFSHARLPASGSTSPQPIATMGRSMARMARTNRLYGAQCDTSHAASACDHSEKSRVRFIAAWRDPSRQDADHPARI